MKKRILGLLLALCLVVGLLPMAAFAEEASYPEAWLYYIPKGSNSQVGSSYRIKMNHGDAPVYFTSQNSDPDRPNNTYAVKWTGETPPTDNYIKLDYTGDVPVLTIKNITMSNDFGLTLGGAYWANAATTTHNTPYKVVLEGTNVLKNNYANYGMLEFTTNGDVTITGDGTLTYEGNKNKVNAGIITNYGDIIFDNVNINFSMPEAYYTSHGIYSKGGDIIIKGGNISFTAWDDPTTIDNANGNKNALNNEACYSILKADKNANNEGGNVIIQDGAKVCVAASPRVDKHEDGSETVYSIVEAAGAFTIKDSDVEIGIVGVNRGNLFTTAPTLTFASAYTVVASTTIANYTEADGMTAPAETVEYTSVEDASTLKYFKVSHTHTGGTATCKDKAVCTACGESYGELAAHTFTRTDCSVDSICSVCTQVAVPAGSHTGGTATCKAKAKCTSCGQEYGELAACTPAADDGDCTTAIKCTVCGKETTAAKTHAYTDNTDASCNNAGCSKTRVVETNTNTGTNGSPQTGDSMNLVLWFSILAVSAIGFVSVVIFSKKRAA